MHSVIHTEVQNTDTLEGFSTLYECSSKMSDSELMARAVKAFDPFNRGVHILRADIVISDIDFSIRAGEIVDEQTWKDREAALRENSLYVDDADRARWGCD